MYVKGAVSSMVEVGEGFLDAKQQEYKWKKNNKVIFEVNAFTCSNRLVVIANFLLKEEKEADGLLSGFEKAGNRGGGEVSSGMSYYVNVCIVIY